MNRTKFSFLLILLTFAIQGWSQVSHKFITGEKPLYAPGDEFRLQVMIKVDPATCPDGMAKAGIYTSGITTIEKSDWHETGKGLWQVTLSGRITGNKKGYSQLTIVRKTDKNNLFGQIRFNHDKHAEHESK